MAERISWQSEVNLAQFGRCQTEITLYALVACKNLARTRSPRAIPWHHYTRLAGTRFSTCRFIPPIFGTDIRSGQHNSEAGKQERQALSAAFLTCPSSGVLNCLLLPSDQAKTIGQHGQNETNGHEHGAKVLIVVQKASAVKTGTQYAD